MLKAKYTFYSTSSCKCQYEPIAIFFSFFSAAKVNGGGQKSKKLYDTLEAVVWH